jgi:cell division protein FtsB
MSVKMQQPRNKTTIPKAPVQRPRYRRFFRVHLKRKHLLWLLAFSLFIFIKVWQKTEVDHMNRRNGVLAEELKALRYENLLLEARIEELRSRERIAKIARNELNMVEVPTIKLQDKNAFERLTDQLSKTNDKNRR